MGLSVPITNGQMQGGGSPLAFQGLGGGAGAAAAPPPVAGGAPAHEVQGTGDLLGLHNTPMHVGAIMLLSGIGLAAIRYGGFRFGFDAGIGRG